MEESLETRSADETPEDCAELLLGIRGFLSSGMRMGDKAGKIPHEGGLEPGSSIAGGFRAHPTSGTRVLSGLTDLTEKRGKSSRVNERHASPVEEMFWRLRSVNQNCVADTLGQGRVFLS